MVFLLDNVLVWHIIGFLLYEIILIPLLYIVHYLYLIFLRIITTNVAPNIFLINITNYQIINHWSNHSVVFDLYLSCFAIALVGFLFMFLINMIKDFFMKQQKLYSLRHLYWFFVFLIFFSLLPIFFSFLFLLVSIFFKMLGLNNTVPILNKQLLSDYENNILNYQKIISQVWNDVSLNKLLLQLNVQKLYVNNFYWTNLIQNINQYEKNIVLNQNIFVKLNQTLMQIKPDAINDHALNIFKQAIYTFNLINNEVNDINTDLNNLNNKNLVPLKQQIQQNINYFNGDIFSNFLYEKTYALTKLVLIMQDTKPLNLINYIERICNNDSGQINCTPSLYVLNWNVMIAIIFCFSLLIILFLYAVLEIRRIIEIIVLFVISPFCFILNIDDQNSYLSRWIKITLNKFFALLIIAIIFQTSLLLLPVLIHALLAKQNNEINYLITSSILGIGVLISSFFSINTILNVFDAKENFLELMGDLYSLKLAHTKIPIVSKLLNKKFNKNNKQKNFNQNDDYINDNSYDLTLEDVLFQKVPVQTTGFESFMADNKTHHYIKKANEKMTNALMWPFKTNISKVSNQFIEKILNHKFKKYHMEEQKWNKDKPEGPII